MLALSSFSLWGCGSNGPAAGGGGGGSAGFGGGGGGVGGTGGTGGMPRRCSNPNTCDDQDPCTMDMCVDMVCRYESLPDDTVCASDTGFSMCLSGECQLIWPSCEDEGAEEGDFCEPVEDEGRTGRCVSGSCEVGPCEIALDCWDGNVCTSGVCDESDGSCSQQDLPNGTMCVPPIFGQCQDGMCQSGGGMGGQGGGSGQGGNGGQGGA